MAGALSPQFKGIHLHFRKCSGNSVFHQFVLAGPGGQHIHNWTTKPTTHQLLLVLRSSLRYACFLLSSHRNSGLRTSTIRNFPAQKLSRLQEGRPQSWRCDHTCQPRARMSGFPWPGNHSGVRPSLVFIGRGTEELPMNLTSSSQAIL